MASVLDLIKHYQHAIEKYPNDEQKILKCIDKLFHLNVTVQHLQETGVGRTVNALRKEPGDVGQAARALVYKWKVMVASEESDQETDNNETSKYNGHDDGNSHGNHKSKYKQDKYETESKPEGKSYRHVNGDHNRSKRKYHSSEEDEPDGKKSKTSENRGHTNKIKTEPKSDKSESDSESDESSDSGSESDTSNSTDNEKVEHKKIKEEKSEQYQSPSNKHSSSHTHRNKSLSSSEKDISVEKHSKNYSDSTKHMELSPKHRSHNSNKHSSKEREHIKEKKEKSSEKDRSHKVTMSEKEKSKELSSKHSKSDKHKDEKEILRKSKSHDKERLSEKEARPDKEKKHSDSSKHSPDKHKSSVEKREKSTSKSDKNSERDKHRSKETLKLDNESKELNKERHREKSKDKSSSSKDKEHKDKRSSSSDVPKDRKKSKSDKNDGRKDKHKSSSKSNDIPKKKNEESNGDSDGIGCESGASFAEALGMVSPVKAKKKHIKETHSPSSFNGDLSPASLLAPDAKLAPLPNIEISALPEISPNYKPRPPPKFLPHFEDIDLNTVMSSKNQRTKVYSGNKVLGKIPTLYEMCVQVLQEHIDALEYTGGVPYEILKPVVDRATPQQLFMLEHYNPYLMEDTDHLWQKFCEKHFRNKKRMEMETWREMYMRCQEEQEIKLKSLTENIKIAQEAKKAPIKQTKMAYVDTVVKPPRNIARKQAQHGTAFAATASPAARVAALATAPNVLKGGRPAPVTTLSSPFVKPKKAPLMQKALQFMRGRKR